MIFILIGYAVIALVIMALSYVFFKEEDEKDPDSIYKRLKEENPDYMGDTYHIMMPAIVVGIFWMPIVLSLIALGIIILLSDDGRPDPNSKWW